MEDRLENVENIMKKYNEFKESQEPKVSYDMLKNIQEKEQEVKRNERHLERLKDELENLDTKDMDYVTMHKVMSEYKEYINNAEKEIEDSKKEYQDLLDEKDKIENPTKTADDKKKEKAERMTARDEAKKDLTMELKSINEDIEKKQLEIDGKTSEIKNFQYEYKEEEQSFEARDDEGKLVTMHKTVKVPINADVYKRMNDDRSKLYNEMEGLKNAKDKCAEYLSELNAEYDKEVEGINNILNNKETEPETEKTEETEPETEKTEEAKPGTEKTEETKPGTEKTEETKSGTEKSEEAKPGVEKPGETKPEKGIDNISNITINPAEGTIFYTIKDENGDIDIKANECNYSKKDIKGIKTQEILKKCQNRLGDSYKLDSLNLDPNILKLLKNNEDILDKYVQSVYLETPLPFELKYNLKGMKDSELKWREKRNIKKIVNNVKDIEGVEVEKDPNILDRIKAMLKSINTKRITAGIIIEGKRHGESPEMIQSKIELAKEEAAKGKQPRDKRTIRGILANGINRFKNRNKKDKEVDSYNDDYEPYDAEYKLDESKKIDSTIEELSDLYEDNGIEKDNSLTTKGTNAEEIAKQTREYLEEKATKDIANREGLKVVENSLKDRIKAGVDEYAAAKTAEDKAKSHTVETTKEKVK